MPFILLPILYLGIIIWAEIAVQLLFRSGSQDTVGSNYLHAFELNQCLKILPLKVYLCEMESYKLLKRLWATRPQKMQFV